MAFMKGQKYNGANLAIPIVGAKIQSVDNWIGKLQVSEYEVHIHHVEISNNESLNRATARAIQTKRYISLDTIKAYGEKPKIVYNQLKQEGRKGVIFE